MELRTFGGFELTDTGPDGQTIRVMGPQKPLALLAYLALSRGHRASRDLVQELLWADVEPERGRKTLRQTVWSIRQRLGEHALRSEGDNLVLDLPLEMDCVAFEAAVHASDLARAWELYAGHFIPAFATPGGAGFEQWADLQRDHYRALWLTAGEELIRQELARQNYRHAVSVATRLRDELPDRLDLWRVLLHTLLSAGKRMQALIEAEVLEGRLRSEQVRPDAATAALLERIRAMPVEGAGPGPERPQADLVGREQLFAALLAAWQSASSGSGRAVVLRGTAGIGKTRLLQDFHDRLSGTDARTVLVRARPADRDLHFGLVAGLAEALARLPGAIGISPAAAAALVDLSPSLSSLFARTEPGHHGGDDLLRLRTLALEELLGAVAEEAPMALLVDDLHWADEASRQVLASLSGRLSERPVLLVLTLRPIRGGWAMPPGADLFELQPLNVPQLEDMVASMAAAEPALLSELGRQVMAVSGGVPLLALAAVELAMERRLLWIEDERWVCPNPERLRHELVQGSVLEQMLGELPAASLDIIVALSLAGRPLEEEILGQIPEPPNGAALLLAMEQRGLVIRSGDRYETGHDKIAEAALTVARPEARSRVSRRLGQALLEGRDRSPRTLRLAGRLLVAAGDPGGAACFRDWLAASGGRQHWHDVMAAAAEYLGEDATVERARALARSIPWSLRLRRGHPRVVAAAGVVLVVAASAAAFRTVGRMLEPFATGMVLNEPSTSRGFLWDTAAATLESGAEARNPVPITLEFTAASGVPTRNASSNAEVVLVEAGSVTLEGTTIRPVHHGRAEFSDLVVRGRGAFRLEFRAGTLPPIRTSVLRASGGFGHAEPHAVTIVGGTINGQAVDSVHRTAAVAPGAEVTGVLRMRLVTTMRDAAILLGTVALWGDRRTNWLVMSALPSHGVSEVELPLEDAITGRRLQAPTVPGRYRIVLAIDAETEWRYAASRTNWTMGEPRWADGDDLADLTPEALATLDSTGLVAWPKRLFQRGGGPDGVRAMGSLAGTILEIVVER